ncbi:SRPBCC domain-containing protein [Actinokineospora sp. 24-640]
MGEKFEVRFTGLLPGTPEETWTAITENAAAWMWPITYEPHIGGAEMGLAGGIVTAWEPCRQLTTHVERAGGWFNTLSHTLKRAEGGTHLTFVHQGVHEDDWATEQASCVAHTDIYYHTLGEYLAHFPGRTATYATADGPDASAAPGSFTTLLTALGLSAPVSVGDAVRVEIPGVGLVEGVIDYRTDCFLGFRTADAMYRFYGRDVWGWPVGLGHHLFAEGADADAASAAWQKWLDALYA